MGRASCIYVLAGSNGAGKSSILGAMMLEAGADYFNPDLEARRVRSANPGISQEEANGIAWRLGRDLLERAIREQKTFALETTLGGTTIASLLESALSDGLEVRVWFVGLATPELHIARVRSRVARGGHDIPDAKIRERFDRSRQNLIRLLPLLTELRLFDNSTEADLEGGVPPQPKLILHFRKRKIIEACEVLKVPDWAKPVVEMARRIHEQEQQQRSSDRR